MFWGQPHLQDLAVHLWEAIADRHKTERWVAGYNLINEPADESRAVVGPFYQRLSAVVGRSTRTTRCYWTQGGT
jgi:endoglucanase